MSIQDQIIRDLLSMSKNPYAFVNYAFDWGEGQLTGRTLEKWQAECLQSVSEDLNRLDEVIQYAIASGHGIGKHLRWNEPILTPNGEVFISDLRVGDKVIGDDGRPCNVTSITKQSERALYRMHFTTGESILCGLPHQWRARTASRKEWTVVTTDTIRKSLHLKWCIPNVRAIEFTERSLPIHPYFVGYLLGTGRICDNKIKFLIKNEYSYYRIIRNLKQAQIVIKGNSCKIESKHLVTILSNMGLNEEEWENRRIPYDYFYNSIENRIELLQGIFDSYVVSKGSLIFRSDSYLLVKDVQRLIKSLGGITDKIKEDKKFSLLVRDTGECCPFSVPSLAQRYELGRITRRNLNRIINFIEYETEDDCYCITVDSINNCYVTGDYIVTHNSSFLSWITLWALSTKMNTRGIVTANTETQLRTKTWPELYKWHGMFIARDLFEVTATSIFFKEKQFEKLWRIDAIPWSQSKQESFAGLHNDGNRTLITFDEACHDDKTEVLTDEGWKYFSDLLGNEQLLTMNPITNIATYATPSNIFKNSYKGDMYLYERRGTSFCITPNHKMIYYTANGICHYDKFINILDRDNIYFPRTFNIDKEDTATITISEFRSKRKLFPEKIFDFNLWLKFLAWFLSEGSIVIGKQEYPWGIAITQNSRYINEIIDIVEELNIHYSLYYARGTYRLCIMDIQIASHLSKFGDSSITRFIPDYIKNASARQIKIFLDTYIKGDGYYHDNRAIIYTSSKKMADDIQILALKTGVNSFITKRNIKGIQKYIIDHIATTRHDGYAVSISTNSSRSYYRKEYLKKIHYDGIVYCAEVNPYHLLFTRRNNYCLWSGNSAIDDCIWEVVEGALTDKGSERLWFAFGNPTRNQGRFAECFTKFRHRWNNQKIDSRTVSFTDKGLIAKWEADYGEDSDFFRVRVRGEFPRSSERQFIPYDVVEAARGRPIGENRYTYAPVILGVDPAYGSGEDESIIYMRQGLISKMLGAYKKMCDDVAFAGCIAKFEDHYKADAVFIDMGFGTGVVSIGRSMGRNWQLIPFGSASTDIGFFNKRAEMWGLMKKWLTEGGCLEDDKKLAQELVAPEAFVKLDGKIQLESKDDVKRRLGFSPDRADALALTFALPVQKKKPIINYNRQEEYDPFK